LLDLGLTIYIVTQLFSLDIFACCVDNKNSPYTGECSYNHIGGASNVGVRNGYCYRKDTNVSCEGDLTTCALGYNITTLCDDSTLSTVASRSMDAFIAILIIKAIGICFSLFLEIKSVCCEKKEPGAEEAEESKNCCKKCTINCCSSLCSLLFRAFFLIFGTAISFIAILILQYTNDVSTSSCETLTGILKTQCENVVDSCTFNNDENFYNLIFYNFDVIGPIYAAIASSAVSAILWVARLAVVRYYASPLTDV